MKKWVFASSKQLVHIPNTLRRGDETDNRLHDLDAYDEMPSQQFPNKALKIGEFIVYQNFHEASNVYHKFNLPEFNGEADGDVF